jgi:dTDP-4-amino-4,6-dideoxygalactose transaminase
VIPIKYKRRQFLAKAERWQALLLESVPASDGGRGTSITSAIPNLGKHLLEEYLLKTYRKKFVVFTNCASDALDIAAVVANEPIWYAPSYTWYSPLISLLKAKAEIRFLDINPRSRMVDLKQYDPNFPLLIPHLDGLIVPPPAKAKFILEDAAQSPVAEGVGYGDITVLSFGSSKKLGLISQGGCLLTNNSEMAKKAKRLAMFGLDDEMVLREAGQKSFLDPYTALCTLEIFRDHETGLPARKINSITERYNEALGLKRPPGLERYSLRVHRRDDFRKKMAERGIETRVWIKEHAAKLEPFAHFKKALPFSDDATAQSVDIPLNEFLSDEEVEQIASAARSLREHVIHE